MQDRLDTDYSRESLIVDEEQLPNWLNHLRWLMAQSSELSAQDLALVGVRQRNYFSVNVLSNKNQCEGC